MNIHSPFSFCVCISLTHTVVRFFSRLVQYGVRLDHVVHHVALGDLFGAELLRSRQVLPVVVAEVIVADDGGRLSRGERNLLQCLSSKITWNYNVNVPVIFILKRTKCLRIEDVCAVEIVKPFEADL